jgi:hypothetical protein
MSWRKWLVRGLVFSAATSLATAGYFYQRFTNPEAVRSQVVAKLSEHLVGAHVSLESADMRLLGGISVASLSLSRRDDPSHLEFFKVPSAVIYPDKEQIFDGKFSAIRKFELQSPNVRIIHAADGRWNVANILGVPHPDIAIPTIVVRQGRLTLEDRQNASSLPGLVLTDLSLTLINDPLELLNFKGTGKSALLGRVAVSGSWNRLTNETLISMEAKEIALGPRIIERLAAYCPAIKEHASELTGKAGVQADLAYRCDHGWTHRLVVKLQDGSFRHPRLPMAFGDIQAEMQCLDGQITLKNLTARSGSARLEMTGKAQSASEDTDLEGKLRVSHLAVTDELFGELPERLKKVHREYAPAGPVSLSVSASRKGGIWSRQVQIHPEDLTITFFKFPYRVEHITGTLDSMIDPGRKIDRLLVDLAGRAGDRPVYLKGEVTGEGHLPKVSIKIWGDNLPLDQKLHAALPEQHQKLAASFHPAGSANFEAFIERSQDQPEFNNRYLIRVHDATARYDVFPYPLENVTGILDIQPNHWEFSKFTGVHKGGLVQTHGRSFPGPDGDRLEIEVDGDDFVIDPELEAALGPELKEAYSTFHPAGRMSFQARVTRLPKQEPDIEVSVTAKNCSIKPAFFPYAMTELTGKVHYRRRWIFLENMQARHGASLLSVDRGRVSLKPEGGVWAEIGNLRGAPLVPDADLLGAMPPFLRKVFTELSLKDPVELRTQLIIDSAPGPVIYWDGEVAFRDAMLKAGVPFEHIRGRAACRGRYNGKEKGVEGLVGNILLDEATLFNQPFRNVHAEIEVPPGSPNVVVLKGLHANLFGGEVYGPVRVDFGPTMHYEVNLTASQIKLEELAKRNLPPGARVSGLATGRLYLAGNGTELKDLTGNGTVDIPSGRLYSLPLVLDLLKFLGLRIPDGTAFEEAHGVFSIRGNRAIISRLDLFGNSISLRGRGEMNLDGSNINLDFYGVWARVIQYLPPFIKEIPPAVSKHLLKIKMQGSLNHVQITTEPLPVILEPFKELLEIMSGQQKGAATRGGQVQGK